jgi:hypothetical protein
MALIPKITIIGVKSIPESVGTYRLILSYIGDVRRLIPNHA